jgi:hypothetical protein
MQTKQITRNEWPSFFDSFSRQHAGWLVTLEIFRPDIGAQVEEHDLALEGVTAELGNGAKDRIEIMIGAKPDRHVTHTITDPIEVSLEHTDEGADHALAIKSADEAMTLLSFRSVVRPEMVDEVK